MDSRRLVEISAESVGSAQAAGLAGRVSVRVSPTVVAVYRSEGLFPKMAATPGRHEVDRQAACSMLEHAVSASNQVPNKDLSESAYLEACVRVRAFTALRAQLMSALLAPGG